MCLLIKTPEYIILFLLIISKNIFGIYGSSGPPSSYSQSNIDIKSNGETLNTLETSNRIQILYFSSGKIDRIIINNNSITNNTTWYGISHANNQHFCAYRQGK